MPINAVLNWRICSGWALEDRLWVMNWSYLIGGLEHGFGFSDDIGNGIIIQTDQLIFFRGVGGSTTNQLWRSNDTNWRSKDSDIRDLFREMLVVRPWQHTMVQSQPDHGVYAWSSWRRYIWIYLNGHRSHSMSSWDCSRPIKTCCGWFQTCLWVNYNDLTATSLEWWLVRGKYPHGGPYFRLVKYYDLPRCLWCSQFNLQHPPVAERSFATLEPTSWFWPCPTRSWAVAKPSLDVGRFIIYISIYQSMVGLRFHRWT